MENVTLRVSKTTDVQKLGSAIAREIEKGNNVSLRSIGVQAVNQTCKGLAIAGGFLGQKGKTIFFRVGFDNVTVRNEVAGGDDDKVITALQFTCKVE